MKNQADLTPEQKEMQDFLSTPSQLKELTTTKQKVIVLPRRPKGNIRKGYNECIFLNETVCGGKNGIQIVNTSKLRNVG